MLGIERCPVSTGVADNFTQDILVCRNLLPCPDHPLHDGLMGWLMADEASPSGSVPTGVADE